MNQALAPLGLLAALGLVAALASKPNAAAQAMPCGCDVKPTITRI